MDFAFPLDEYRGKGVCPEGDAVPRQRPQAGGNLHPFYPRPDLVLQGLRLVPHPGTSAAEIDQGALHLLLRRDGRVQRRPDVEGREDLMARKTPCGTGL